MEIAGRAVLVTGAGKGLGAALARVLAREGARLLLVARTAADVEGMAASIRAGGGEAHALAADMRAKEDIHRIAGTAAALVGGLDVVIHNASTLGPTPLRLLLDTEGEDLEGVLAVNLIGPFRLNRAVVGGMVLRGRGLIVHLSSDAAVSGYPGWGAYGVSKAALDHLGRIWAAELEGTGVKFLTVDPGEMRTQMHAEAMPEADPSGLADPAEIAERILSLIRGAEGLASGARLEAASARVGA